METQQTKHPQRGLSRRALLGRGALGLAGLLVMACGQSAGQAPAATTAPAAKPTGQPAAPAAAGAATSAPPAAAGAPAGAATSAPAASAPKPAAGGAPVKLTFWRHQYDPTDKAYREIIFPDVLSKLNIEVDYQVQRDDDYKTKMLPQLASGTGPDIFEATESFRLKFGKAGGLRPCRLQRLGWQGEVGRLLGEGRRRCAEDRRQGIPRAAGVGRHPDQPVRQRGARRGGRHWRRYREVPADADHLGRSGPWAAKMTLKDASGTPTRDGFMIQHGYGPDRAMRSGNRTFSRLAAS